MATFLRYEKKFLINKNQHDKLLELLADKIKCDEHSKNGKYNVYTIYCDDKDNDCLRTSVSRPIFKEKMRIRSYKHCNNDDDVYLEVKKKYDGYGSKRRIKIPYKNAIAFINNGIRPNVISKTLEEEYLNNQITNEMENFLKTYKVKPFCFMEVDREAYYFINDKELRITFDNNIKYRYDNLDFLDNRKCDRSLLDDNTYVCEIKFKGAIPYELANMLNELEIYRTHYSKIGAIYNNDNHEITQRVIGNMKKINNK